MNRFKEITRNVRNKYYGSMAVAATALALSPSVFAQTLSSGLADEADSAKAELWIIGGIIVGVCFIGFLIGRGKRVSS